MAIYKIDDGLEVDILGIPQGVPKGGFSEKEILAAIIAVEDILDMERFALDERIADEWDAEWNKEDPEEVVGKNVFCLYDKDGAYLGGIDKDIFFNLRDVIMRLEHYHADSLYPDYEEFEGNGLDSPDPMVEKALILIENHTYIKDLFGAVDADTRDAMRDKYYGKDGGENIKRAEALFNFGPSDDYVGIDSLGRLDIDALGYLADRLIAAKIMDTQGAYEVIEYNGQLCEVYVDNGDISDFAEEIKNGTLLECDGVCAYDSYRELIDAQVEMILNDFNDIGLYEDDGSWGFYLTEKELRHIGLGEQLEKEKAEYEISKDVLIVGEHEFELVDELPLGYQFWNIGRNMPDGYLPLCRPKAVQPFDGAREIEADTLKAVRLEGAQTVLRASIEGFETVEKMESFVRRNQGKKLGPNQQRKMDKVLDALEALRPVLERSKSMPLEERLGKAIAQSEKMDIQKMREFLQEHDRHFATDEYLDGLSVDELKEYYRECKESVMESYRDAGDDWAQRRESLAAENLGFHG